MQERLARLEDPDSLEPREADDVLNRMITHFRADGDGNIAERIVLRILLLDIVATNTTLIVRRTCPV